MRAVIFDLWETLIDWDQRGGGGDARRRCARSQATSSMRALELARRRGTPRRCERRSPTRGPRRADGGGVRAAARLRAPLPRAAAGRGRDAAASCAPRGYLVGLITVCSEDVETLWPESEFAGLFDAEVFSNAVGADEARPAHLPALLRAARCRAARGGLRRRRRERRARGRAARRHGCDPDPPRRRGSAVAGGAEWDGPRVTSIPGVLEVLGR